MSGFIVIVPSNVMWWSLHPTCIVGASRAFVFSAIFSPSISPISESVDVGRWGPCCSVDPTIIIAVSTPFSIAFWISFEVISWIFIFLFFVI